MCEDESAHVIIGTVLCLWLSTGEWVASAASAAASSHPSGIYCSMLIEGIYWMSLLSLLLLLLLLSHTPTEQRSLRNVKIWGRGFMYRIMCGKKTNQGDWSVGGILCYCCATQRRVRPLPFRLNFSCWMSECGGSSEWTYKRLPENRKNSWIYNKFALKF